MIGRLLTGAMVVASGLIFSQVPEFAQQYRQRIGGAVDELRAFVERFDADAASENLTREAALQRHLASSDDLFRKRGISMRNTIGRLDRLSTQQEIMANDSAFVRIVSLVTAGDHDLAKKTLNIYEPALPVTTEGGIMALIGGFVGWLIARLFGAPKRMLDRRLAYRRQYEA